MDIRYQLAYSDNSRRLLHRTLAACPDALDRPFPTLSEFSSLRKLLAHLIGAEERWIEQRIAGRPLPGRYEDRAAETVDGLFSDWERIRAKTRAFIDSADAGALGRVIPFSLPSATGQRAHDAQLPAEQILFQVFNHQTFHLGQISMALQCMNIDPPNFDYVLLHGEAERNEE